METDKRIVDIIGFCFPAFDRDRIFIGGQSAEPNDSAVWAIARAGTGAQAGRQIKTTNGVEVPRVQYSGDYTIEFGGPPNAAFENANQFVAFLNSDRLPEAAKKYKIRLTGLSVAPLEYTYRDVNRKVFIVQGAYHIIYGYKIDIGQFDNSKGVEVEDGR